MTSPAPARLVDYLRFILPSTIGIAMMLVPIRIGGSVNIGMGFLADLLRAWMAGWLPALATLLMGFSACVSLVVTIRRAREPDQRPGSADATVARHPFLNLFVVGRTTLIARLAGALAALLVLLRIGPAWLTSETTGGVILDDLIPVLVAIFIVAPLVLPFLTDFGLMEFVGTLMRSLFRPLFTMPGRSAIDALASWMGSAPVGVLITMQQFEDGFYTEREAATIATTFSVVSVAFAFVIADFLDMGELFFPYYGTIVLSGVVAAIIMPRIPPLSRKRDVYYEDAGRQIVEDRPAGRSLASWGLELALARARRAPGPAILARRAILNICDIWFGLLPLVMTIGCVALVLADRTPVFTWLSAPLVPGLQLLGVPEATAAAPALLVGFADQFLPAVLAQSVDDPQTRFVIGCASVSQLIYMSELGALLLKSKIPVGFGELLAIFLLRTAITVPIIAGVAALLF